ncbi:MAG: Type secretion system domain protein [Clostridia bacterium]|nr:Type secretion system domain protein [Clostridia bacterium]
MQMLLILFFSFVTTFVIILAIYSFSRNNKMIIAQRLNKIAMNESSDAEEGELAKPFHTRVVQPILKQLAAFLIRVTPKEIINNYENKIIAAGTPYNFGINEWLSLQAFLTVLVPLGSILIGIAFKAEFQRMALITGIEVLIGILGPNLILISKIQQRQKEIIKTLPDILDLLTVSVEAGLGFDAALGKVVEKMPGVLAKEFDKVLQEIKMGKPRRDALRNMSARVAVIDVTTFIASVIQADQLGVSIGNVLRIQSDQMRLRRRQRAQEKAMKAPIKMLLPMVFFIFPTIFTVLLGPVVIRLIDTFKK